MIALSTASALRFCVCVCVCVRVCCRAEQPVLLSAWTAAVQTSAPGSWLDSGRMQEVSRMKYDLNGSRWNGKYHIRGVQYMSPCPKDTGLHYTPALMYLWEFQCLLWRTLPMLWCVHQYHATSLCVFFFFLLPLNSAWRIDNRGLICLPPPLRGSTAKQRVNCVSVFCGILSNLKDWGNQCFFHFRSGDAAFDNRPVAKWVVSLKVATKISIMGITSCILQSVIGPITAA